MSNIEEQWRPNSHASGGAGFTGATDHHIRTSQVALSEAKPEDPFSAPSTATPSAKQPPSLASPPGLLKSPVIGGILKHHVKPLSRHSHSRYRSLDCQTPQGSSDTSDAAEQGALWRQLKSKFVKRTMKDDATPPSALPSPSLGDNSQGSSSRRSPLTATVRVSLLPVTKHQAPLKPQSSPMLSSSPSKSSVTNLHERQQQGISPLAKDDAFVDDPLFQALAPRSQVLVDRVQTPCSSIGHAQLTAEPHASGRITPGAGTSCQRVPSIRRLKKRSPSIRRSSLPSQFYQYVDPEQLATSLSEARLAERSVLIFDLRSPDTFLNSSPRLRGSMNISIPTLLAKRFRQGNFTSFSLKSFLQDDESKQIFTHLCPDGRWESYQIYVMGDENADTNSSDAEIGRTSTLAFVTALAAKQADAGCINEPIQVLRGSLSELMRHLLMSARDLIVETVTPIPAETSAGGADNTISSCLFSTPTAITPQVQPLLTDSHSLKSPLSDNSTEAVPLSVLQAAPRCRQVLHKPRPVKLQQIETCGPVKASEGLRSTLQNTHVSGTSHPPETFPSAAVSLAQSPISAGLASAFVHTGISAPSRLPTIVMPLESQATAPGEADFHVSVIIPGFLYLGPEPLREKDALELESVGIKRILNVATECDTQDRWKGRFEKISSIPMRDSLAETNVQERFEEACVFLDDADLLAKPTYVHCKAGKSRSVTITLAYLIHRNHWPLKRAYAHVLDRRQGVSPNIGFVAELMRFEEAELGGRSRGILGTGATPAHEKVEYFAGNRNLSTNEQPSESKLAEPRTPRSARSDLEGRPTVVRHLSFIASTALGLHPDKPRTRDQRSSTHVIRNRDSMPPGLIFSHHDPPVERSDSDNSA